MNTREIMQIGMDMVGLKEIPPDSAIYVEGDGIKRILAGIDMGVPEIMLAKQLGYDCVWAHHPQAACLTFPEILDIHVDLMVKNGVPLDEARRAIANLKESAGMSRQSGNYDHSVSVARLLKMPFLNVHNPLDELGRRRMQAAIDEHVGANGTLQDVVDALNTIPEIKAAPTKVAIKVGQPDSPAGKVVVAHGAGTNGGYDVAKAYFNNGIGTVVYIHCDFGAVQKLRAEGKGNLIISGHIASDLAGIMPYIEELRKRGLEVTGISGIY